MQEEWLNAWCVRVQYQSRAVSLVFEKAVDDRQCLTQERALSHLCSHAPATKSVVRLIVSFIRHYFLFKHQQTTP